MMKLGLCADSHYSSAEVSCGNRYNSQALDRIRAACGQFEKAGCDRIICLGDLIDREPVHDREVDNLKHVAEVFRSLSVPVTVIMGNHDGFSFTREEFYEILGEECRPADIYGEDVSLIFADACFFRSGKPYGPGDDDWTDTCLPDPEGFRRRVGQATGAVYVFLHQNLDPTVESHHILANAAEARRILENTGKVRAVYQGHYHPGNNTELNGISYVTIPALCTYEDAARIILL